MLLNFYDSLIEIWSVYFGLDIFTNYLLHLDNLYRWQIMSDEKNNLLKKMIILKSDGWDWNDDGIMLEGT